MYALSREILDEWTEGKRSFDGGHHQLSAHSLIECAMCVELCVGYFERYINEYTTVLNFKESLDTA